MVCTFPIVYIHRDNHVALGDHLLAAYAVNAHPSIPVSGTPKDMASCPDNSFHSLGP